MKRCPTCQKEYADSMRFCQTDGTPLVEAVAEQQKPVAPPTAPPDPYKTIVGGSIKMDADLLEIPEQDDPMKTMITPISFPKPSAPSSPKSESAPKPPDAPIVNIPPVAESKPPAAPPVQPNLSTPDFGNLPPKTPDTPLPSSPSQDKKETPKFDSSYPKDDPPPTVFGAPPVINEPDKNDSPFGKPSSGAPVSSPFGNSSNESSRSPFDAPNDKSSPFDKPFNNQSASPFDAPVANQASPFDQPAGGQSPFDKTPPPPYKEQEPMFGAAQQTDFSQPPFGQSQSPFGQSNDPFGGSVQPNEWTPPPAPVAGWQDQGLGANTPFQPPMSGAAQNQTLPIIALVLGILSLCCYVSPLTGIGALVTGYLGMKNASSDPVNYGGKNLAIAGMILGGIFTVLGIVFWILVLIGNISRF